MECELCKGPMDQYNATALSLSYEFPKYICQDCRDRLQETIDQLTKDN